MFKKTVLALVLAGAATLALQGSASAGYNSYGSHHNNYETYDNSYDNSYDDSYESKHASYNCDAYWEKYVYWKGQYDYYHTNKAENWMNHWYNKWYSCSH